VEANKLLQGFGVKLVGIVFGIEQLVMQTTVNRARSKLGHFADMSAKGFPSCVP
jgi:hypothetical protein